MTKKVLLLLADGFEPLEAAGFTDVFGWAAIDGSEPVELVTAGFRSPLRATFGFSVIPQALIADIDLGISMRSPFRAGLKAPDFTTRRCPNLSSTSSARSTPANARSLRFALPRSLWVLQAS